jgi:hypothetical protein
MSISTIALSASHQIECLSTIWPAMVNKVLANQNKLKRGCIYNNGIDKDLPYISLLELQEKGPSFLDMSSDLHSELLRQLGIYDFATEFVFLLRQGEHFAVCTGDLRPDGWQDHKSEWAIRIETRREQLAAARLYRLNKSIARSGNKKNKRKRK